MKKVSGDCCHNDVRYYDNDDDGNDDGDDDRYGFSSTFDIKGDQAVLGSGQVVGGYFEVVVMLMMMMMRTDD